MRPAAAAPNSCCLPPRRTPRVAARLRSGVLTCWLPVAEIDDFFTQRDTEPVANRELTSIDQPPDVGRRRRTFVENEVAVRRRNARAADGRAFQPGPINQCPGRPRN